MAFVKVPVNIFLSHVCFLNFRRATYFSLLEGPKNSCIQCEGYWQSIFIPHCPDISIRMAR